MKRRRTEWERLVSAARQAPVDLSSTAPYGFAARVAANAVGSRGAPDWAAFFARFSWRALSVAAVLMGAAVLTNLKPVWTSLSDAAASFAEPPVETEDLSG